MWTVLLVIAAVLAAFLVYVSTRPGAFRIERTGSIAAAPERIYAIITDFHRWHEWSPWERDPDMKRTFGGPPTGLGASLAWEGNKQVGQGRMEIVGAEPPGRIEMKLDFIKPFEAHNMVEFAIHPDGGGSRVVWAMYGPVPFLSKLMTTFVSMDRMVGKDFEQGLANLKRVAEG